MVSHTLDISQLRKQWQSRVLLLTLGLQMSRVCMAKA